MENFDDPLNKFINNDAFIAWVTHPDQKSNAYWKQWMDDHPDEVNELLQAKELVELLSPSTSAGINTKEIADDIWQHINAHTENESTAGASSYVIKKNKWYAIAASAVGLILVSSFAYYFFANKTIPDEPTPKKEAIQTVLADSTLSRTNTTTANKVVYLVDGSKVTLQPGASINHIAFLHKDKREVYLQGSAFFEISKDAKRPFYVYTNNIVLKVLGTSFTVTPGKNTGDVQVLVHTGKVSVYKNNGTQREDVMLTPNQQVVYNAHTKQMTTSTVETASVAATVKPAELDTTFHFEEVAVEKIFDVMEEAYGIGISYDKNNLSNRKITSYMNGENFEEKLEIICDALDASYTIKNNKVFIQQN